MRHTPSRLGFITLLYLIIAARLAAQAPTATISAIVTDATGAVVPGVTVTAINSATAQRSEVISNEQGFYVLTQLPVGAYTIEAQMSGFKKFVRQGFTLTTAATVALDIPLAVGAAGENVTVTGETPLLQTRTSDVSTLIESKAVQDLPLGDRRTLNIIKLTGAAVFVNYDAGAKPNFSLAGGRTQSQMFWIDGGSGQNMRLGIGQVDIDPPVDTVQEVKVFSNSYAAEYGGSAGGVIIATTKSGTNEFHGSLSGLHQRLPRCGGGDQRAGPAPPALLLRRLYARILADRHQRIPLHLQPSHQSPDFVRVGRAVALTPGLARRARRSVPAGHRRRRHRARHRNARASPTPDPTASMGQQSFDYARAALKTGAEVRPSYNFEINRPSISGQFNFNTQPTGLPGLASTGLGLASLLVGFPNGVTLRETERWIVRAGIWPRSFRTTGR